jgi:hypothetical protein
MAPEKIREVQIARRLLLGLYLVVTVGLCVATAVGILRALTRDGSPSSVALAVPSFGRGALAELRTLVQELRQRGETVGRTHPTRLVDLDRWEAWAAQWLSRLERVGARYGLNRPDISGGAVAEGLRKAYSKMRSLLNAYGQSVRTFAAARREAIEGVEADLSAVGKALRSAGRDGSGESP